MPVYAEKEKVDGQTKWFIRTYVKDEFGKSKQIKRHDPTWIGRDGKKEAERYEAVLKNKIMYSNSLTTFGDYIEIFLEVKQKEVEITTYNFYKQLIRLYVINFFPKNLAIRKFTNKEAIAFKNRLNSLNLSLKYKKTIYSVVENMFELASRMYDIKNPFKNIGNFVEYKKDFNNKEMNILTTDEFNLFIQYETNIIFKYFFTLLFYTGMRKGELLALKWENIDFNNKQITINNNYNTNYKIEIKPKTKKSMRKILMNTVTYNALLELHRIQKEEYLFRDLVKATPLREHCAKNLKKANINKHIRIHDFRHSFASMCINQNVPIAFISEYMGHEHITTTLDTYGHLYPDSQYKLVSTIDKDKFALELKEEINKIVAEAIAENKPINEIKQLINKIL